MSVGEQMESSALLVIWSLMKTQQAEALFCLKGKNCRQGEGEGDFGFRRALQLCVRQTEPHCDGEKCNVVTTWCSIWHFDRLEKACLHHFSTIIWNITISCCFSLLVHTVSQYINIVKEKMERRKGHIVKLMMWWRKQMYPIYLTTCCQIVFVRKTFTSLSTFISQICLLIMYIAEDNDVYYYINLIITLMKI